jgi:hypothetical protein
MKKIKQINQTNIQGLKITNEFIREYVDKPDIEDHRVEIDKLILLMVRNDKNCDCGKMLKYEITAKLTGWVSLSWTNKNPQKIRRAH